MTLSLLIKLKEWRNNMNYSKTTKMGVLLKDEAAKAVLLEHFGDALVMHSKIKMAGALSLEQVAKMSNGLITDELLAIADADLQKL
jgi:hypothetical protein